MMEARIVLYRPKLDTQPLGDEASLVRRSSVMMRETLRPKRSMIQFAR